MEYQVHEESPRVLVVDDEKVIREILSDFLTMEGYVVRTVEDGDAALRELERVAPDVEPLDEARGQVRVNRARTRGSPGYLPASALRGVV